MTYSLADLLDLLTTKPDTYDSVITTDDAIALLTAAVPAGYIIGKGV